MNDFNWDMGSHQPEPEPPTNYSPIVSEPLNMKFLRAALAQQFYKTFDPPQPEQSNCPPPLSPQEVMMMDPSMQQQQQQQQQQMPF